MDYIYAPATDAAKLQAFFTGPTLREVMKDVGVQGAPTITFMKPMSADFIPDRKLPGVIGHAVNQELGAPNRLIIYHQAEDLGALRAFAGSTELKDAMKREGVAGAPDIRFVQVADFANS